MCGWPLAHPLLGTWTTTQACSLDWEWNLRPFDLQAVTQPLSHTRHSKSFTFKNYCSKKGKITSLIHIGKSIHVRDFI